MEVEAEQVTKTGKKHNPIFWIAAALMLLWFLIAHGLQFRAGLADNGNFSAAITSFSSGAAGFEQNWPESGTQEWRERFFNYWLPEWKLDWKLHPAEVKTSTALLWIAGAVLNTLIYSAQILYLPVVSLVPRILLLAALLLFFRWADGQENHRLFHLLGIGIPLTLLFTSFDYTAWFNSFYLETGAFIYLVLLLISLVSFIKRRTIANTLLSILFLALLAASKASNIYWPVLVMPLITYILFKDTEFRTWIRLLFMGALAASMMYVSIRVIDSITLPRSEYNAFFNGLLLYSEHPSEQLLEAGFDEDAVRCIDQNTFTEIGAECLQQYQSQLHFRNTLNAYLREPAVIFPVMQYLLKNMQTVGLDTLGKFAIDDPRSEGSCTMPAALNVIGWLQTHLFPIGILLGVVLLCFVAWFSFLIRLNLYIRELSILGLVTTLGMVLDMLTQFISYGNQDMIRHLFLANLLFVVAGILFLNSLALVGYQYLKQRKEAKVSSRVLPES